MGSCNDLSLLQIINSGESFEADGTTMNLYGAGESLCFYSLHIDQENSPCLLGTLLEDARTSVLSFSSNRLSTSSSLVRMSCII